MSSPKGHQISFTKKQARKLDNVLRTFYTKATERSVLPSTFLLLIQSVGDSIKDERSLEQYELDAITFILESIFAEMEEEDLDIIAEEAYHKIRGWWPIDPPYFEKLSSVKEYDDGE